jgi:Protein of unknown function DUF262
MSETLTALASENLNPSLRSMLEDVQRGNIRVPRFQRPFVWKDDQRLELLESIRDNMPIGSLLVWRTTKFELDSFPAIGPHFIPPLTSASSLGRQYLLDGHQRVSTLLGVLLQPVSPGSAVQTTDEDTIDWDIQYDLEEQEFVFTNKLKSLAEMRPLLPLWTLFDGRIMNRHMRAMREKAQLEKWKDVNLELCEERADQLSYNFQQYRIPIVVMVTDSLDLAVQTFKRVNSQGTPMNETHLVAALTWTSTFDLRDSLAKLRAKLPPGWLEMDDRLFLQVCKGLINLDMTKVTEKQLVDELRKNKDLLDRAAYGIEQAIEMLARAGGVMRQDLLPYSSQLVFLAIEFANRNGKKIPELAFMNWFWRTGRAEVFGSASFRQVRAEQDILNRLKNNTDAEEWGGEWAMPKGFDSRFALIRLWMLRMATRPNLVDETGVKIDAKKLLETHGKEAFVRLLATPTDASATLRSLLRTLGNRFLVDPAKANALRECLLGTAAVPPAVLATHFIEQKALKALRAGDLETFIDMRNTKISKWDLLG